MSTAERVPIGEVAAVRLFRFHASRRLAGALIVPDRRRAIDRYIDYFGGRDSRAREWRSPTVRVSVP